MLLRSITQLGLGFSLTLGMLGSSTLFGADENRRNLTGAEIQQLQAQLKSPPSLSVNFRQTIYKAMRKKTVTSSGQAHFAHPNRFHWKVTTPTPNEWIYDGSKLVNYKPNKREAYQFSPAVAKAQELRKIVDMVLNLNTLLSNYTIRKAEQVHQSVHLQLQPKVPAGDIVLVHVRLDRQNQFISKVKLYKKGDNTTTFEFYNPRHATAAQPGTFTLPAGVQVKQL